MLGLIKKKKNHYRTETSKFASVGTMLEKYLYVFFLVSTNLTIKKTQP